MSTWTPGDIAMITAFNRDEPYRAAYDGKTWRAIDDGGAFCVDQPTSHRPLVVIDPEDPEHVERLNRLQDEAYTRLGFEVEEDDENDIPALQAALRAYADPTPPKPEEPTGFLAEIEDADGQHWFRAFERGARPWVKRRTTETNGAHLDGRYGTSYDGINAVHVHFEGVPA